MALNLLDLRYALLRDDRLPSRCAVISRREFFAALPTATLLACSQIRRDKASLPAEVFLIRHAEEPPVGSHLDDRGQMRAKALVGLFSGRFNKPTALFATKSTQNSSRSIETLQPLADALHLSIDQSCATLEFERLASLILNGDHANGHVLACWHRESIADVAVALGVRRPPQWPSAQYDRLWWIRFVEDRVEFRDEPQRLLPGDSATAALLDSVGSFDSRARGHRT